MEKRCILASPHFIDSKIGRSELKPSDMEYAIDLKWKVIKFDLREGIFNRHQLQTLIP